MWRIFLLWKLSVGKRDNQKGGGSEWWVLALWALPRRGPLPSKGRRKRGTQGMPAHTMDLSRVAEVENVDGPDNGEGQEKVA